MLIYFYICKLKKKVCCDKKCGGEQGERPPTPPPPIPDATCLHIHRFIYWIFSLETRLKTIP